MEIRHIGPTDILFEWWHDKIEIEGDLLKYEDEQIFMNIVIGYTEPYLFERDSKLMKRQSRGYAFDLITTIGKITIIYFAVSWKDTSLRQKFALQLFRPIRQKLGEYFNFKSIEEKL